MPDSIVDPSGDDAAQRAVIHDTMDFLGRMPERYQRRAFLAALSDLVFLTEDTITRNPSRRYRFMLSDAAQKQDKPELERFRLQSVDQYYDQLRTPDSIDSSISSARLSSFAEQQPEAYAALKELRGHCEGRSPSCLKNAVKAAEDRALTVTLLGEQVKERLMAYLLMQPDEDARAGAGIDIISFSINMREKGVIAALEAPATSPREQDIADIARGVLIPHAPTLLEYPEESSAMLSLLTLETADNSHHVEEIRRQYQEEFASDIFNTLQSLPREERRPLIDAMYRSIHEYLLRPRSSSIDYEGAETSVFRRLNDEAQTLSPKARELAGRLDAELGRCLSTNAVNSSMYSALNSPVPEEREAAERFFSRDNHDPIHTLYIAAVAGAAQGLERYRLAEEAAQRQAERAGKELPDVYIPPSSPGGAASSGAMSYIPNAGDPDSLTPPKSQEKLPEIPLFFSLPESQPPPPPLLQEPSDGGIPETGKRSRTGAPPSCGR